MGQELKVVKQFDRDKDGRLNNDERKVARGWLAENGPGGRGFFGGGRRGGRGLAPGTPGRALKPSDVKTYGNQPLYDPAVLRTLFLQFENTDWEQELAAFNNTDVEVPAVVSVDGKVYKDVGVHFRGMSSFMMVPEGSKRSLNLSFDFVDEILKQVAKKAAFPNLRAIVVAGHSAGGQYANRYEMSNQVHDTLGVPVSYVVANPSSYAWPAAVRPLAEGDADPAKAKDGWSLTPDTAAHTAFTYGPFDATKVPNFNRWPMGLENRTAGYTAKMSDEQLKKQLVSRPTTYLLGQVDTLPLGGFDSSPGAMAQGPTRRARGEAFAKYVNEQMGAKHAIQIVSECGHNDRCIFTTDAVFPVIFPK